MSDVQNGARNTSGTAHGTRSEPVPRAREPLPSYEQPTTSQTDALGRARENALTARIREIHPLDAATVLLADLRPDWKPEHIRAVIARDRRPWTTVITAAFECAHDPKVRSPAAIENHGPRRGETGPQTYPSAAEALALQLCPTHADEGFRADACPLCRRTP